MQFVYELSKANLPNVKVSDFMEVADRKDLKHQQTRPLTLMATCD